MAGALLGIVVAVEEEELVLRDGAANGAAKVVEDADRLADGGEEVARAKVLVIVEPEGAAVEGIRAALSNERDGRATRHTLLGVAGHRGDVDGFDHFRRHHVTSVVGQPEVDAGGTINARDVVVRVGAVDVGTQGAHRRVGDGVLECRGTRTRHQIDQTLVVAQTGQRHVDDHVGANFGVRVGLVSLQLGDFGGDGNLVADGADFHPEVEAGHGVDGDHKVSEGRALEAGYRRLDVVVARDHVRQGEGAIGTGGGFEHQARAFVG